MKQETKEEKIYFQKLMFYKSLLEAEQSLINLKDLTSGSQRYKASSTLRYIQNLLKQLNATSKVSSKEVKEAESSMLDNIALNMHVSETLMMLPPHLVDLFEDKYNKMYQKLIKNELKNM